MSLLLAEMQELAYDALSTSFDKDFEVITSLTSVANNRAAPERHKLLVKLQRLSVSGERDRWAALYLGWGSILSILVRH